MRRISAVFGVSSKSREAPAPAKGEKPSLAPIPPPTDSWVVDEAFLEESSRLIPASPDDVDDQTRNLFLSKTFKGDEWLDADMVEFGLGQALDIFPENATFISSKWIFWTDNVLNKKLLSLMQALARPESRCLESRTEPDFQFRRFVPPI